MNKRIFSLDDYLYFAISAIAFFFLIRQYIPCVEDFDDTFSAATGEPIHNLKDVIISRIWCYMHLNGRILANGAVHYICAISGPIPFFIISALAAGLIIVGLTWIVRHQTGHSYKYDKYLISLCLLFFIPMIGMTYIGHVSHVVNYLWGSAVYVWVICAYLHIKDDNPQYKPWQAALICVTVFVAGTYQESFALGIAGAMFLYHIFQLKTTSKTLIVFMCAFACGMCITFFAPGNFERFNLMTGGVKKAFSLSSWIAGNIYQIKMLLKHCPPISIFAALCLVIPCIKRRKTADFLKKNFILFMPCLLMAIFAVIIAYSGDHQLVIVGLLSSLLLIILLTESMSNVSQRLQYFISAVAITILIGMYIPIWSYRSQIVNANKPFVESMLTSTDSIALSTDIEHFDREVLRDSYFRRFTNMHFIQYSYTTAHFQQQYSRTLFDDHKKHTNIALPEPKQKIIDLCTAENRISEYIYNSPDLEYYIVRIPADWEPTETIIEIDEISKNTIDKFKDIVMHRKGKVKTQSITLVSKVFPDYYRYFIEEDMRYIIMTKNVNRQFVSARIIAKN